MSIWSCVCNLQILLYVLAWIHCDWMVQCSHKYFVTGAMIQLGSCSCAFMHTLFTTLTLIHRLPSSSLMCACQLVACVLKYHALEWMVIALLPCYVHVSLRVYALHVQRSEKELSILRLVIQWTMSYNTSYNNTIKPQHCKQWEVLNNLKFMVPYEKLHVENTFCGINF